MDRYVRVDQRKSDQEEIEENEVRIMASGRMRNYVTYALALLTEKGHDSVVLKAMGQAINKTVIVAEILKRRIPGLHQNTEIGSIDITDTWEPLEEGLNRLETTRHVSMMSILLSQAPLKQDTPGYQTPLPESAVVPARLIGVDQVQKGGNQAVVAQDREGEEYAGLQDQVVRGRGRGRYRGRGRRGGPGRGRGPQGAGRAPAGEGAALSQAGQEADQQK